MRMRDIKPSMAAVARSLFSRDAAMGEHRRRQRREARHGKPVLDVLEGRVVLSGAGSGSLLASLSYVGVVTSPVVVPTNPLPIIPRMSATGKSEVAQLKSDEQTLLTELQTLATKSGVTITDLQALKTDSRLIAQAGFHFNSQTLNPVISQLATAVASGASTAQAQSAFTGLFSGSSVSPTVINTTFTDLVQTISDSKVTTNDLSTVAGEQAAIQTDLQNLHSSGAPTKSVHHNRPVFPPIFRPKLHRWFQAARHHHRGRR